MADPRAVLRRCDSVHLDRCGDPDQSDCAEAETMVLNLTESSRVQKVLLRQLFVLDSLMSLVEGLESADQLITQPCPPQPEGRARGRWKRLKLESRSGAEETETLLRSMQERIDQFHDRRNKLTQLVKELYSKKQQCEQLDESLQKAHNALRSCDRQLTQLRAESEAALSQLISWQRLRDMLQVHVSAVQDVMHINLLSFNQSELCVQLRPRPSSDESTGELEPLTLSITWSHDDRFRLQESDHTSGLLDACVTGRRCQLSAALLEALQRYTRQFELLLEIQSLRSSFAIDWRPAQRLLVYLKTAALVCHLEVEDGYPRRGRARLLSVRRDGRPVDTCGLQPRQTGPSLTDWLVYLCSCPLV